jgi:allantoin racemase
MARDEGMGGYFGTLQQVLAGLDTDGVDLHVEGITRSGGTAELFRFFEFVDTRDVLANALRAQREGFDAFLIGNIGDPGIAAAREMCDIPVLGLCECSSHVACMMGATFGHVGFYPDKFGMRIRDNVERAGLSARYVGMRQMRTSTISHIPQMNEWYTDPERRRAVAEDFRRAAQELVADGAEVVVAAGGVLMALVAEEGVDEVDGAPVLNGIAALIGCARTAVAIRRTAGHFTSKAGAYASPPPDVLAAVAGEYGGDLEQVLFGVRPGAAAPSNSRSLA